MFEGAQPSLQQTLTKPKPSVLRSPHRVSFPTAITHFEAKQQLAIMIPAKILQNPLRLVWDWAGIDG
ncbi:MAG: hypothetical protein BJG00_012715 [Limnothrix sp. CACIAM 69d]|nr:MAG: hypothetical protein BJG00_012715 [Limnothrix sp. CACIAM 69d]